MKTLILACVLGLVGATASAYEPCFDNAFEAAASTLGQQGLKPYAHTLDSKQPVSKDQREVAFDIKLLYWTHVKKGEFGPSTDTKNFYVRMQNGGCKLIEAPQPSN